jgi:serine-type D-Ala-D-Ala carboxypeptidase (penicillin-binding protein 5/6)
MKKKFLWLITFMFITTCINISAYAKSVVPQHNSDIVNVNFKSALLMEESSGKIIYEHNSHEKLAPASVTKIMTMLLAMEDIDSGKIKLSDKITATARAKSIGGTTMYLETGEVRTVEEILKGIAIQSANDGAVAMAEYLGGTEESFIKRMNERAKQLGMMDTNFVNPMGFYDANHYTSAYDVAIMSRELLKHKKILDYSKIWQETISEGRKTPFTLTNTNKMLRGYNGCDGLKTGYVSEAKYCISATALRGSVRFIAVIMGAPTSKERSASASKLLNYGFAKFESKKLESKGNIVGVIKLPKSNPAAANIVAKDDLSIVTEKGTKINMEKQLELNKDLKLPIKKGDIVGNLKAVEGNKVYGTVPVVCDNDIVKMKVYDVIKKSFKTWLNLK